eukprot:TRINITY_DN21052_c0_g1_i2.p1 TRINITY_DN21052_c0_g1~~TRINITY_DN21052_c0_g1_i2.p1  ORF type:complete len:134 (-),score=30.15 TRINITY_DN21052_c0_g1_i2:40-441(-)
MLVPCSVFFLMIRRPPRSTQGVSSAASDVYKRQRNALLRAETFEEAKALLASTKSVSGGYITLAGITPTEGAVITRARDLSLIHISEPTRPLYISYAVFCLKKKKKSRLRKERHSEATSYAGQTRLRMQEVHT